MKQSTHSYYTRALQAVILLCSCIVTAAHAANTITLTSSAMQEVIETDASGNEVVKLVAAKRVVPGNEVIYVIEFENNGNEAANNIVINNPVPEFTRYKADTATGDDTTISYSVDGGKQFDAPGKLTVKQANGSIRTASAKDYTAIRWVYNKPLPPGGKSSVQYRVVIQ